MQTELYVSTASIGGDSTEQLRAASLNDDERAVIQRFIKITGHLQEIDGLFHVFRFNQRSIHHFYSVFDSDRVVCRVKYDFPTSDYIAINALVINFISSGKTLIESVENFLKSRSHDVHAEFKTNYISKEYDEIFLYRLLTRLRDFAQHGHLPVSISDIDMYCFDLDRIIKTPRFNHNKKLEGDMIEIQKVIREKHYDRPKIALALALTQHGVSVTKIYLNFLKKTRVFFHEAADSVDSLIQNRPGIVNKSPGKLYGYLLYEEEGILLHAFDTKPNPRKVLSQRKNEVSEILKEEQSELDRISKSFIPL